MTTPVDRVARLDLLARLKSSYPELPDARTPDLIDHDRFSAYVKTPHDVGGEPDAPLEFENKQYEIWEENTYVTCEVLGWRGIWLSEERRRMGNVDLGRTIYLGLPYYGRWLLAVARVLVEKHHIGVSELAERVQRSGIEFVVKPYTRFEGQTGEQSTMFFLDPSGNALEFKAFQDIEAQLFAVGPVA